MQPFTQVIFILKKLFQIYYLANSIMNIKHSSFHRSQVAQGVLDLLEV